MKKAQIIKATMMLILSGVIYQKSVSQPAFSYYPVNNMIGIKSGVDKKYSFEYRASFFGERSEFGGQYGIYQDVSFVLRKSKNNKINFIKNAGAGYGYNNNSSDFVSVFVAGGIEFLPFEKSGWLIISAEFTPIVRIYNNYSRLNLEPKLAIGILLKKN